MITDSIKVELGNKIAVNVDHFDPPTLTINVGIPTYSLSFEAEAPRPLAHSSNSRDNH